jgi:hypothetical protein
MDGIHAVMNADLPKANSDANHEEHFTRERIALPQSGRFLSKTVR